MRDRIPALVVSGFLGSGKTTLVRHILAESQRQGQRVAVISNEFGELGIDQALLGQWDEAYAEIAGGCVCCRLSDELVDTLQMLWERVRPDRVIVETSGVAFPFDVQMNFWREPVSEWVDDDVAVVVVAADQVAEGRDLDATFSQQVSSADLLLVNRTDLVTPGDLERVEARLREIEPDAPLLHSVHGEIDPDLLFPPDPEGLRKRRRSATPRPHDHEAYEATELAIEPGVDADELCERLRGLGALRTKGFVETASGPRLVQGVGPRIELRVLEEDPPRELLGRLVVIRRARD